MAPIKSNIRITLLITALALSVFGQDRSQDLALEAQAGRARYAAGDTVVAGVKATIPPGYHLYANPLGPGIGRALNLYIDRAGAGKNAPYRAEWGEARKSVPKRYTPSIGSWVWAYESEAYFFVKGAVVKDSAADVGREITVSYKVTIDALICRTSCVPVEKSVTFDLLISSETAGVKASEGGPAEAFPSAPAWQAGYARSEPMEFKTGAPAPGGFAQSGIAVDGEGAPQTGIKLDLGGLSSAPGTQAGGPSPSGEYQSSDSDENAGATAWDYSPLEKKREYNFLTAALFALAAGLALNLTPCIFPVLGIRVLSFAQSARESRRKAVVRSLAFAGGIVAVFLLLAACAAFAGFSWGQQFQNPAIMVGIVAIIFLFALGMFDFYTMGVPQAVSEAERKANAGLTGDFLKGAAATVMATPCGGPFLGALLAWALLQKPLTIFILFAVMGVGMALPYVLLSSSKKLFSLLPKPGRWIEDFKHIMGFLLLAFAVNLMTSLDPRLTVTAVGICLSILCAASANKRFAPFGTPVKRRAAVALASAALVAAGTVISAVYLRIDIPLFNDDAAAAAGLWQEFSPEALNAAHEAERNVIVNFTASWCTSCKVNKAAVLDAAAARELYAEKNILLLAADITNPNPQAESLLHYLGSRSIPFVAIFPADSPKNPIIMRDVLSKDKFLAMLRELP